MSAIAAKIKRSNSDNDIRYLLYSSRRFFPLFNYQIQEKCNDFNNVATCSHLAPSSIVHFALFERLIEFSGFALVHLHIAVFVYFALMRCKLLFSSLGDQSKNKIYDIFLSLLC